MSNHSIEFDYIPIPVVCMGCGHPDPTGFHIAGCAEAQRKLREPLQFTRVEDVEGCPNDGQTVEWHRHTELGPDGQSRTNGEFIDCDFGMRTPPASSGGGDRG